MAKKILPLTSQQIVGLLKKATPADNDCPKFGHIAAAGRVLAAACAGGAVNYQQFAADVLPKVADLRIEGGWHISGAAEKLLHPAYEKADLFREEPELLAALLLMHPSSKGVSGLLYYATAPLMFSKSASYIFVGESIDIPAMAAADRHWRRALVGKRNEAFDPNDKSSLRFLVDPTDTAGVSPKSIRDELGESDPQFLTVEDMCKFLDAVPEKKRKASAESNGLSETDLMSLFGLG